MVHDPEPTTPFAMPRPPACFFCDPEREQAGRVAGSQWTLTLVNPRQHQLGQVVVVTRRHCPTLLDLNEEETVDVMQAARCIAEAITRAYAPDGVLMYQNNGVASGQEVPHFHLHVVPQRFSSSRWGNEPPHVADALGRAFTPHEPTWLDRAGLERVARTLRSCLEEAVPPGDPPGTGP